MKVSLVYTNVPGTIGSSDPNWSQTKFRDRSIGHIPPVALLNVAAVLEAAGVEVQLIDQQPEKLNLSGVLNRLAEFSPDLIGFTLTTYNFRDVLPWIENIKKATGTPIMVGGPHLALYPEETMSHTCIDYAIIGECEIPLPIFIKAFQKNREFHGIKSLAYRDSTGQLIVRSIV